jgi:hypothetical protein
MNPDAQQPNYNPAPQVSPAQPVVSAPQPSMQPPISSNTGYEPGENAKISSPKYWLTVYGIFALYILLEVANSHLKIKIIGLVVLLAWLVVLILCYRNISKAKATGQDVLTKDEKYKMVVFMSVDPVIAQAFFYYRLKKSLPQTARVALKIGWKVFFLQLLPTIVGFLLLVIVILLAIPALQKNSWYNSNSSKFVSQVQTVSNDVNSAAQDVQSQNATQLQTDCQQLKTDVASLQQIPAYPVQSTASKISQGENALATGATDCLNGLSQQDTNLINQAGNNFVTGLDDLNSIHSAVTTK